LALIQTKIIIALFGIYAGSIITSLLIGKIVFKEKFPLTKKIALFLTFLGLGLFLYPFSLANINLGLIFGLLCGLIDGITNAFRKSFAKTDKFFVVFLTMLGGIAISGFLSLISDQNPLFLTQLSTFALTIGIFFGMLLFSVNYLLLIGFQNFDLNLGTIIISSELFFGLLLGIIFYREIPNLNEFIGGSLIILAIIVSNLNLFKIRKKQS